MILTHVPNPLLERLHDKAALCLADAMKLGEPAGIAMYASIVNQTRIELDRRKTMSRPPYAYFYISKEGITAFDTYSMMFRFASMREGPWQVADKEGRLLLRKFSSEGMQHPSEQDG